ncbi:MAG: hypothetical protein ACI4LP_11790 [Anaerovoracaceae bacterium]
MEEESRKDKLKNSLLDTATNELQNAGNEAIKTVLNDIKDWIKDRYLELKHPRVDTEKELKRLQREINQHNHSIEIGMEKEEIAVMWAMRKLGYSKEDTDKVLNLASKAYNPKETD